MEKIKMETWESPSQTLPPIRYSKREERELIEQDPKVKGLVNNGFLLDIEFNSLIYSVMSSTEEISLISNKITRDVWEEFIKEFKDRDDVEKKHILKFIQDRNKNIKERIKILDKNI